MASDDRKRHAPVWGSTLLPTIVSIALMGAFLILVVINPNIWASLSKRMTAPFTTWYGIVISLVPYAVTPLFFVEDIVRFKQAARGSSARRSALRNLVWMAVWTAFWVGLLVITLIQHYYAVAAAIGAVWVVLFTVVKLMGGGAAGAAGAKLFNVIWDRVFKPKSKTNQSGA